jgi:hypothetical protein
VNAFHLILRETGECYGGSHIVLRLELRQSGRHGAWEVELVDREQHRRICHQYDDEAAARDAVEQAYAFGRQFGRWKIHRANGYDPAGPASATGWEREPVDA